MRRTAVMVLAGGLLSAALLAGCAPTAVSYNDGDAVGQSLAAASAHGALAGSGALLACRRQWVVSGSAADSRSVWIRGCVAGIRDLQRTIGSS